jgi:hypothetical protein
MHVGVVMLRPCAFCQQTNVLADQQIVRRGRHVYLCVPRGQLVQGFLIIAPYSCTSENGGARCLSLMRPAALGEIAEISRLVRHFYAVRYGMVAPLIYEQGRAGSGEVFDSCGHFPHHAHLCCLPAAIDLHSSLRDRFEGVPISSISNIPVRVAGQPYVYIEGIGPAGKRDAVAYIPRTAGDHRVLATFRLKPMIARLLGRHPAEANWRADDEDTILTNLAADVKEFLRNAES